ncbi:MAG: flagellar biosynthetic protein FliO [Edaphobacter sp.]
MQLLQKTDRIREMKISPDRNGLAGWVLGLLRRLRGERQPATKQMHLLETLPLGGKRQLMLVSCAGEHFLIGGGLESVETIVRIRTRASQAAPEKNLDRICH